MEQLEPLTLKLLKNPFKYTSTDYINLYNIIYNHCTEYTNSYEIRGIFIYNRLQEILIKYFKSMRNITSLNNFYELCEKSKKTVNLLECNFYYLERFFIKVHISRNDNQVISLRNLYYKMMYKYYISTGLKYIEEYIFYEINNLRTNYNSGELECLEISEINKLIECVEFMKKLFVYTGDELQYEKFLEMYYDSFIDTIEVNDIDGIKKEIIISRRILQISERKEYYRITSIVIKNFTRFIKIFEGNHKKTKFVENQLDYFKEYKNIELIVKHLTNEYIVKFFEIFNKILFQEIEYITGLPELFLFYVSYKNEIIGFEDYKLNIEEKIIHKVKYFSNASEYFISLINKYMDFKNSLNTEIQISNTEVENVIFEKYDTKILENIFQLINLIYQKPAILKKINRGSLERMLNSEQAYKTEYELIRICEDICGLSHVSWLKSLFKKYFDPITQDFGLSNQDFNFHTNMRLVARDFCYFDMPNINLHPTLNNIKNVLIRQYTLKYPKSEFNCCYSASYIIVEFNNYGIKLSTDKASLLLFVDTESNIERLREVTKDPNFEFNLDFLIKHNLLICEQGNNVYYNREYKQDIGIKDLFKYQIKDKSITENNDEETFILESAIQSNIMRYLKKHKRSTIEELYMEILKVFNLDRSLVLNVLGKLEEMEYVQITDGMVIYCP